MKSLFRRPLAKLALAACLILAPLAGRSDDIVKLQSGETLQGRIVFEGSDSIRLEIPISATIKDTRTILRTDIAEIIRVAPDDLALNDLRKRLPAPSLLSPQAYRDLIATGPQAFLDQHPASRHKEEVEKILAELREELDQAERGGIKIDGEWISAQRREQFKALTDARIRGVSFQRRAAQNDFLGAMRDFETLDKQFQGSPPHAAAIPVVREMLPVFGNRLQQARRNVDILNQKWEEDKALLREDERMRVEAARKREIENYERAVAQEKAAGIKWLSVNENSAASLDAAIALVRGELDRLAALDLEALKKLSAELVKADEMIAEGKLADARALIAEATGQAAPASGKGKPGARPSARTPAPRGGAAPSTYAGALLARITELEQAATVARKQAEDAAQGQRAAGLIRSAEGGAAAVVAPPEAAVPEEGAEAEDPEAPAPADAPKTDQGGALTALMAGGKAKPSAGEQAAERAPPARRAPSRRPAEAAQDDEESAPRRPSAPVASSGGGFSFQKIMIIVAVVMVIALGVMKALGIGGKKADS